MNYELAKKLKDAGFPQNAGCLPSMHDGSNGITDEHFAHIPTLSELILACGSGFRNLILHTQFTKKLSKPWEAVPNKKLRPTKKAKSGETPEEAVAQLWIELVTKK